MRTVIAYKEGQTHIGPLAKSERRPGSFQRAFDVLRDAPDGWYKMAWPPTKGAFERITREAAEQHAQHGDWARRFTSEALG